MVTGLERGKQEIERQQEVEVKRQHDLTVQNARLAKPIKHLEDDLNDTFPDTNFSESDITIDGADVTKDGADVTKDGTDVTKDGVDVTKDGADGTDHSDNNSYK